MFLVYSIVTSILLSVNITSSVPYTTIEKAFESNNAKEITALGKTKILVNILGKESAYSQSQASLVLQDFLTKHPCSSFAFIFKGKESDDGTFAIGNYTSKSEKYRVTIYFKKEQSAFKIESLTIEKD